MANTKSKEVNLTKRVQTTKGLRYCQVVLSANGRVKPDWVIVNGQHQHHPDGAYYLEWRQNGRRVRLSAGDDAQDAAAQRQRKEAELNDANNGISIIPENGHHSLAGTVADYLEEIELTKKKKTHAAYSTALSYFLESCHKLNIEDVKRRDLLEFAAFLRDKKDQSARSCWNKFSNVMTFLKSQGVRGLLRKDDWPKFVEEEPEIYEKEDLETLFKACTEEERLWFEFFMTSCSRIPVIKGDAPKHPSQASAHCLRMALREL